MNPSISHPFKLNNKKALSAAVIRAAFFVLIFSLVLLVLGGIHFTKAEAKSISLAESLGYQIVEMTNENLPETLQVAIYRDTVSKKDALAIAKELNKEKK